MTPKERAKLLFAQLQKLTLQSRPAVIEATIRDAALYITKLPKAEHDADGWPAAMG